MVQGRSLGIVSFVVNSESESRVEPGLPERPGEPLAQELRVAQR